MMPQRTLLFLLQDNLLVQSIPNTLFESINMSIEYAIVSPASDGCHLEIRLSEELVTNSRSLVIVTLADENDATLPSFGQVDQWTRAERTILFKCLKPPRSGVFKFNVMVSHDGGPPVCACTRAFHCVIGYIVSYIVRSYMSSF